MPAGGSLTPTTRCQVSHADRDDAALLRCARDGDVSAFAVLVHRHTPVLVAAAQAASADGDESAAVERATRTWQRALRGLRRAAVEDDVEAWLLELQGTPIDAAARDHAPLLTTATQDALWAELASRWPRGRRPVRVPTAVGRVALVLVLLVLAVTLPAAVLLTTGGGQDPVPPPTVTAVPVDDDEFDLTDEDL